MPDPASSPRHRCRSRRLRPLPPSGREGRGGEGRGGEERRGRDGRKWRKWIGGKERRKRGEERNGEKFKVDRRERGVDIFPCDRM